MQARLRLNNDHSSYSSKSNIDSYSMSLVTHSLCPAKHSPKPTRGGELLSAASALIL